MIRGIVFDLDDTLFDESDYVRSGFLHVAGHVGKSADEVQTIAAWLCGAFDSGMRRDTFDHLFKAFPSLADRFSISELVSAYRTHAPAITLAPGIEALLEELRRREMRLAVLTDGPVQSQDAKVAALGLQRWFEPIIRTEALGTGYAKPSPSGFRSIARDWGFKHPELCYVGDNPHKDFAGPRQLGWLTIRLRRPTQLRFAEEAVHDSYRADFVTGEPLDVLRWAVSHQ